MDIADAQDILLKELAFVRQSEKFEELEVAFMGGEPFMNFPLIKKIVEWLLDLKQDVPFITSCSTNGTLIDETKKEWLRRHKDVFIPGLSYDGDISMQQQNRGTSKKQIDMQFFMATWPKQAFHMTISKETLPHLAQGALALQRAGGKLEAALAQGIDWTDEDAVLFRKQLGILHEAYLENRALKPINLLGRPLFGIATAEPIQGKFCGTGTGMITYDVDGKTYPCHMFSPIVIGLERALDLKKSGITDDCHVADHFCDNCKLMNWCPTCYGFNYRLRGEISARDHSWCKMIRSQATASIEFQIAYYHKHIDKLTEKDMAQLKGGIEAYQVLMESFR